MSWEDEINPLEEFIERLVVEKECLRKTLSDSNLKLNSTRIKYTAYRTILSQLHDAYEKSIESNYYKDDVDAVEALIRKAEDRLMNDDGTWS